MKFPLVLTHYWQAHIISINGKMPRLIDKQNLFGVIESLDEQISKHFQIS